MKSFVVILLVAFVGLSQANHCKIGGTEIENAAGKWQDIEKTCYEKIRDQIDNELNAALTYLSMGAYFTTDRHYRPGIAHFFLESANEERQHAKDLMAYILLRGESMERKFPNGTLDKPIHAITVLDTNWVSIKKALITALAKEKSVTENFKEIIKICEGTGTKTSPGTDINDYHAADLMTGTFLEEQHDSVRKIAGHLASLAKMEKVYKHFAEIMFDRSLIQE